MSKNEDLKNEEVLNNRDALNRYGFESDLERDKAILNFAFSMFIGLLAFFKTIRVNTGALICAIMAIVFCLITIFLAMKVLKQNSKLARNCLSRREQPDEAFLKLLKIISDQNGRDSIWSYRSLWIAMGLVVLCVLFYSGITIEFPPIGQ